MKTDDPKLTAYALGELSTAECAEIEASLRDDTALAAEIEATRNFAARLRTELLAEEGAPLEDEQRREVLAIFETSAVPDRVVALRVWRRRLLQVAAVFLLCAAVAALLGARSYMGARATVAASGIADPVRWDKISRLRKLVVRVGDKLTGDDVARDLGAAREGESPAEEVKWASAPGVIKTPGEAPYDFALSAAKPPPTLNVSVGAKVTGINLEGVSRGEVRPNFAVAAAAPTPSRELAEIQIDKAHVVTGRELMAFADVSATQAEQTATSAQSSDPSSGLATLTTKSGTGALVGGEKVELGVSLGGTVRRTVSRAAAASEPQLTQVEQEVAGRSMPALELAESAGVPAASQNRYTGRITSAAAPAAPAAGRLALVKKQQEQARQYFHAPGEPDDFGAERAYRFRQQPGNTEAYDAISDNAFLPVKDQPLSTLSIDVDTASYANVRRFLTSGSLPPKGAVRIEEMLNYFTYDYPQPAGDAPFSATMDVAACPWTPEHRLVRIGLKGRDLARSERPNTNLVFLIDVSGSMNEPNKLPLVKESLRLLIDQLDDRDQVAIAVYAGASGTVLEPTRDKAQMRAALDRLQAGGSTNGAGGIQLAYELAARSFIKGGTNRVILATDGDFNVGITDQSALVELITRKAQSGVFLSVLGYGMGNLKDSTLEKLADKGNGNYGYIDTLAEAKKTLVQQMNGTLYTIAKDVKIQVEFNPAQASGYRLIGYENRLLAKEDFNDDKKDAGEIGAGHMVTALYEVVPVGGEVPAGTLPVDALKYSAESASKPAAKAAQIVAGKASGFAEMLTLKLRYKKPDGDVSKKLEFPLTDRGETWEKSSPDFRWAAAVASFGMLLRDSPHKGMATWDATLEMAREGKGDDSTGYREECLTLMERAKSIWAGVER